MAVRRITRWRRRAPRPMLNPADEAVYCAAFPYYAELCALSEIRKHPGFGVALRSGMGGHSLLYLNGVRRNRAAGYPLLELAEARPAHRGVGISVNSHYRNANWVAADGPAFLWRGALGPDEKLTRAGYAATQAQAQVMGVLDGIEFHTKFFRDKPAGMTERDFMYEISVGTDYAARFGRNIYRARVPLDRPRMAAVIAYLNQLNAPYRDGSRIFEWHVVNNNCAHVAHNALAAAGLWAPWPTGQCCLTAALNFPVPKNEFVDLVLRANDLKLDEPASLHADLAARQALLELGTLPTGPGALMCREPAIRPNEVYDIDRLRLIFYDHPLLGRYRRRLARMLGTPRYGDLRANARHFAALYALALARPRGIARLPPDFAALYQTAIARGAAKLAELLARLEEPAPVTAAPAIGLRDYVSMP